MNGTEIAIGLDGDLLVNDDGSLKIAEGVDLLRQDLLDILYEMPVDYLVGERSTNTDKITRKLLNWIRERLPLINPIEPKLIDAVASFKYPGRYDALTIKIYLTIGGEDQTSKNQLLPDLFYSAGSGIYPLANSISYDLYGEENIRTGDPTDPTKIGAAIDQSKKIKAVLGENEVTFPIIRGYEGIIGQLINNPSDSKIDLYNTINKTIPYMDIINPPTRWDKAIANENHPLKLVSSLLEIANRTSPDFKIESFEEVITIGYYDSILQEWVGKPTNKLLITYEPTDQVHVISKMKKFNKPQNSSNLTSKNDLTGGFKSRIKFINDLMLLSHEFIENNVLNRYQIDIPYSGFQFKNKLKPITSIINSFLVSNIPISFFSSYLEVIINRFFDIIDIINNQVYTDFFSNFSIDSQAPERGYQHGNNVFLPYKNLLEFRNSIKNIFNIQDNPRLKELIQIMISFILTADDSSRLYNGISPGLLNHIDTMPVYSIAQETVTKIVPIVKPGKISVNDLLNLGDDFFIQTVNASPITDNKSKYYADFIFLRPDRNGFYSVKDLNSNSLISISNDSRVLYISPLVFAGKNARYNSDKTRIIYDPIHIKLDVLYTRSIAKSFTRQRIKIKESNLFPLKRNTAEIRAIFDQSFEPGQYLVHYNRWIIADNLPLLAKSIEEYSYANNI